MRRESAVKASSSEGVQVFTILLIVIMGALVGCATLQPTSTETSIGGQGEHSACRAPYSKGLSAVAGLCVAVGQVAGAAITSDISQGGAAVLTLGTAFMPDHRPICIRKDTEYNQP